MIPPAGTGTVSPPESDAESQALVMRKPAGRRCSESGMTNSSVATKRAPPHEPRGTAHRATLRQHRRDCAQLYDDNVIAVEEQKLSVHRRFPTTRERDECVPAAVRCRWRPARDETTSTRSMVLRVQEPARRVAPNHGRGCTYSRRSLPDEISSRGTQRT